MKNSTTELDDFDFENATVIKHPMIIQLQANKKEYERVSKDVLSRLDDDVIALINEHSNAKDIQRINTMVRTLFA